MPITPNGYMNRNNLTNIKKWLHIVDPGTRDIELGIEEPRKQ